MTLINIAGVESETKLKTNDKIDNTARYFVIGRKISFRYRMPVICNNRPRNKLVPLEFS